MRKPYKARVSASKANTETEIREAARKLAHRPVAEVVQYLRESRGISADPDFIRALRTGGNQS